MTKVDGLLAAIAETFKVLKTCFTHQIQISSHKTKITQNDSQTHPCDFQVCLLSDSEGPSLLPWNTGKTFLLHGRQAFWRNYGGFCLAPSSARISHTVPTCPLRQQRPEPAMEESFQDPHSQRTDFVF